MLIRKVFQPNCSLAKKSQTRVIDSSSKVGDKSYIMFDKQKLHHVLNAADWLVENICKSFGHKLAQFQVQQNLLVKRAFEKETMRWDLRWSEFSEKIFR